ncbi:MAG: hypothetical protein JWQ59_705 [Cryobacterium sp.]|jgi:hypothetical protein|nr:hypothetical protein [Cryobacterium sp.]
MTTPQPAPRQRMRPGTIALLVGLPLLALVLIAVAAVVGVSYFRGTPINDSFDAAAESRVVVTVRNASMTFGPSPDDRVHVTVTGSYTGPRPTVSVQASGDETTITGGCRAQWFSPCSLRLTVTLPESLPLTVTGDNGRLSAEQLTGDVSLHTTNGAVEVRSMDGRLDLRTTNGAIAVADAASSDVTARTTNGRVELELSDAPDSVEARSTNGAITIRVPDDDESYFVTADTTNGNVDTDEVPSERTADRTITAETTNGAVTIERSRR